MFYDSSIPKVLQVIESYGLRTTIYETEEDLLGPLNDIHRPIDCAPAEDNGTHPTSALTNILEHFPVDEIDAYDSALDLRVSLRHPVLAFQSARRNRSRYGFYFSTMYQYNICYIFYITASTFVPSVSCSE